MTSLRDLLSPTAVAVIGASDDPTRIGGRPIAYMLKHGFKGSILPVNPKRATVQGLAAVPSVAYLSQPIDYAIVAVPAPAVNDAIRVMRTPVSLAMAAMSRCIAAPALSACLR